MTRSTHSTSTRSTCVGIVLAALGGLSVFGAQLGMGASWRIGVSDDQGTDLVTGGWFSFCRNPIYAAMIVGWTGFALMVPTWLAFASVVVIALGLELQVRVVVEPYLRRTHGDEYGRYARRVGRFVPGWAACVSEPVGEFSAEGGENSPTQPVSSKPIALSVSPHSFIEGVWFSNRARAAPWMSRGAPARGCR